MDRRPRASQRASAAGASDQPQPPPSDGDSSGPLKLCDGSLIRCPVNRLDLAVYQKQLPDLDEDLGSWMSAPSRVRSSGPPGGPNCSAHLASSTALGGPARHAASHPAFTGSVTMPSQGSVARTEMPDPNKYPCYTDATVSPEEASVRLYNCLPWSGKMEDMLRGKCTVCGSKATADGAGQYMMFFLQQPPPDGFVKTMCDSCAREGPAKTGSLD